jgi:hypothetical protein
MSPLKLPATAALALAFWVERSKKRLILFLKLRYPWSQGLRFFADDNLTVNEPLLSHFTVSQLLKAFIFCLS